MFNRINHCVCMWYKNITPFWLPLNIIDTGKSRNKVTFSNKSILKMAIYKRQSNAIKTFTALANVVSFFVRPFRNHHKTKKLAIFS